MTCKALYLILGVKLEIESNLLKFLQNSYCSHYYGHYVDPLKLSTSAGTKITGPNKTKKRGQFSTSLVWILSGCRFACLNIAWICFHYKSLLSFTIFLFPSKIFTTKCQNIIDSVSLRGHAYKCTAYTTRCLACFSEGTESQHAKLKH